MAIGPDKHEIHLELDQGSAKKYVNDVRKAAQAAAKSIDEVNTQLQQSYRSPVDKIIDNFNQQKKLNSETAKAAQKMRQFALEASVAAKNAKELETFVGAIGKRVGSFLRFSIASFIVTQVTRPLLDAARATVDFDTALNRLQQVTGDTKGNVKDLGTEILNLGKNLGIASSQLLEANLILAQAGFSLEKIKQLSKTLALTELAPSFDSLESTTEGIISVVNQFRLTGPNEVRGIQVFLDTVNKVSKEFAVESANIIEAVRNAGSVFAAAENVVDSAGGSIERNLDSFRELVAVFTTIRSTSRLSPSVISTGLRTVIQRLQRSKTESDLQGIFGEEFSLRDIEGQFIGVEESFRRISGAIKDLGLEQTSLQVSEIVEALGGIRQAKIVIPALFNQDFTDRVNESIEFSEGSLVEDAEVASQRLEVRIQKLRKEFFALFIQIAQSDAFQQLIDLSFKLASALKGVVDAVGSLAPYATTLGIIGVSGFLGRKAGLNPLGGINNIIGGAPGFARNIAGGGIDLLGAFGRGQPSKIGNYSINDQHFGYGYSNALRQALQHPDSHKLRELSKLVPNPRNLLGGTEGPSPRGVVGRLLTGILNRRAYTGVQANSDFLDEADLRFVELGIPRNVYGPQQSPEAIRRNYRRDARNRFFNRFKPNTGLGFRAFLNVQVPESLPIEGANELERAKRDVQIEATERHNRFASNRRLLAGIGLFALGEGLKNNPYFLDKLSGIQQDPSSVKNTFGSRAAVGAGGFLTGGLTGFAASNIALPVNTPHAIAAKGLIALAAGIFEANRQLTSFNNAKLLEGLAYQLQKIQDKGFESENYNESFNRANKYASLELEKSIGEFKGDLSTPGKYGEEATDLVFRFLRTRAEKTLQGTEDLYQQKVKEFQNSGRSFEDFVLNDADPVKDREAIDLYTNRKRATEFLNLNASNKRRVRDVFQSYYQANNAGELNPDDIYKGIGFFNNPSAGVVLDEEYLRLEKAAQAAQEGLRRIKSGEEADVSGYGEFGSSASSKYRRSIQEFEEYKIKNPAPRKVLGVDIKSGLKSNLDRLQAEFNQQDIAQKINEGSANDFERDIYRQYQKAQEDYDNYTGAFRNVRNQRFQFSALGNRYIDQSILAEQTGNRYRAQTALSTFNLSEAQQIARERATSGISQLGVGARLGETALSNYKGVSFGILQQGLQGVDPGIAREVIAAETFRRELPKLQQKALSSPQFGKNITAAQIADSFDADFNNLVKQFSGTEIAEKIKRELRTNEDYDIDNNAERYLDVLKGNQLSSTIEGFGQPFIGAAQEQAQRRKAFLDNLTQYYDSVNEQQGIITNLELDKIAADEQLSTRIVGLRDPNAISRDFTGYRQRKFLAENLVQDAGDAPTLRTGIQDRRVKLDTLIAEAATSSDPTTNQEAIIQTRTELDNLSKALNSLANDTSAFDFIMQSANKALQEFEESQRSALSIYERLAGSGSPGLKQLENELQKGQPLLEKLLQGNLNIRDIQDPENNAALNTVISTLTDEQQKRVNEEKAKIISSDPAFAKFFQKNNDLFNDPTLPQTQEQQIRDRFANEASQEANRIEQAQEEEKKIQEQVQTGLVASIDSLIGAFNNPNLYALTQPGINDMKIILESLNTAVAGLSDAKINLEGNISVAVKMDETMNQQLASSLGDVVKANLANISERLDKIEIEIRNI